jgi:branched-chain amino acid transport system permease protein
MTTPGHIPERARALTPSLAATVPRFVAPLAIGIGAALLAQLFLVPVVGPFYSKILIDIGINVILAVSLNLVNGFTGQFSIGHAGFMAVGGYVAGVITYYGSYKLWGSAGLHGGFLGGGDLLFVAGCLAGGLLAGVVGFLVGLPSLRLRGDYLAIVTLGFGEILRVLLQRTDDVLFVAEDIAKTSWLALSDNVGGALGFTGLPYYTTLFWVFTFVTLTLVASYRLKESSYGRASCRSARTRSPPRRWHQHHEVQGARLRLRPPSRRHRRRPVRPRGRHLAQSARARLPEVVRHRHHGRPRRQWARCRGQCWRRRCSPSSPSSCARSPSTRMIVYALALIIMMIVRPQGLFGIREIWELEWSAFRRKK